jgi:hypothetical protein
MHGQDQTLKNVSNTLDNATQSPQSTCMMNYLLDSIHSFPLAKTSFYYSPKQLLQLPQH